MIHQYKLNGYNIVLDVCSGSVHVVDEAAYDLIGLYENTPREAAIDQVARKYPELDREELEACYEDITALKDAGKLFAPDTFAPMAGAYGGEAQAEDRRRCQGPVPAHRPHLQPELLLLLRLSGQVPRRPGADVL